MHSREVAFREIILRPPGDLRAARVISHIAVSRERVCLRVPDIFFECCGFNHLR